jgi:hypothetical protein
MGTMPWSILMVRNVPNLLASIFGKKLQLTPSLIIFDLVVGFS